MREEKRSGEWIPDEAIAALTMERSVHADESPVELAERILIESAPHAAAAIVHLATNSPIERMRYDAARFVLDASHSAAEHHPAFRRQRSASAPWDELFTAITSDLDVPLPQSDQPDQQTNGHQTGSQQGPVVAEPESSPAPGSPDRPATRTTSP